MTATRADDDWILAGRYRVDGPIGSGGMGAVWRGYDTQLDRRVAIKFMHQPSMAFQPGTHEAAALAEAAATDRERFLREIRTTARLEHPGIPAVYDFGVANGRLFLVMQLLYGQTLADLIASRNYAGDPWPVSWAAAIGAQIASVLVEVHRVDVVHRDIKPSNVMVTAGGLVRVLDFGVAILQGASALPKLTQIGATVGSPPYMSREQALGNPVGPPSDVYSLGCVMYEMLTGQVPFDETPSRSYRDHHVNTPAPSTRSLRPDAPEAFNHLVLAMLAKAPGDRPSAEAVYEALHPLAGSSRLDLGERDPRRPFVKPLAPAPRPPRPAAESAAALPPMTSEELIALTERVPELVDADQLREAIDLLDSALTRLPETVGNAGITLQLKIDLADALFRADDFGRAARLLDEIMPALDGHDDVTLLRYYAGVSHAEIGDIEPAIAYLRVFLAASSTDSDPLFRDAKYQLGMLLAADGELDAGLKELNELRPLLAAEFGERSIHVRTLDRRMEQIKCQVIGQA